MALKVRKREETNNNKRKVERRVFPVESLDKVGTVTDLNMSTPWRFESFVSALLNQFDFGAKGT